MSQTLKNTLLLMAILVAITGKAQDVIYKTDKSEIKSKVTEISETLIKYKKWDHLDGPDYSVPKAEVFMIIYANGRREMIEISDKNRSGKQNTNTTNGNLNSPANQTARNNTQAPMDKISKLQYKPTRLNVGFQSPLNIGIDQELRIIKNILNIGVAYHYSFPKDDYILTSNFGFVYASVYGPINRLTGNYEKQNKGLFVFGQAGYGATSLKVQDFNGKTETLTSGGFTWRLGADFFISEGFGITLSTYEGKSFFGGIVLSLL